MSPLVVDVGAVAHGGHCIARHPDGRVIFVRHAIPGEKVEVVLTGEGNGGKFLRGDAVRIIDPSPHRRTPPCPYAGPDKCGGCDFQHVKPEYQRELKRDVVVDALKRQGKFSAEEITALNITVADLGDDLGWRTRVRYATHNNSFAMRKHRSHDLIDVTHCPLGVAQLQDDIAVPRADEVELIAGPTLTVVADGTVISGPSKQVRVAAGREFKVSGAGFWQVHHKAPDVLIEQVLASLRPKAGDHILDLYAGVGLFAGALATAVGPGGRIDVVESSEQACTDAKRNLHDIGTARIHHADVAQWLAKSGPTRCDLVVLDPPRSGAGPVVMERLAKITARTVAYVACDPVALARDLATARALGWKLREVVVLDLFPNTHHVESIATLERLDYA